MRPITVDNLGSIRLRDSSSGSNIILMVKASPGGIQNVQNFAVGDLFELEKAVETSISAFLVLPNFYSCFYNSIETRYMFSIS